MDVLVRRVRQGAAEVFTLELTELGFSLLGWEEGPHVVLCAVLESCFDDVGATPEEGPFNAALAKARHGAVMVLDDRAMPLVRIWCLFEVRRAADFGQTLRLVVDEGDVEQASTETLQAIGQRLRALRAFRASASNEDDRNKIHFRVLDSVWRSTCVVRWPTLLPTSCVFCLEATTIALLALKKKNLSVQNIN